MKSNFGTNPWGIRNSKGQSLTPAYIREYFQCYCRGEKFQLNRKENLDYFSSDSFLSQFKDHEISTVAKIVQSSLRWGIENIKIEKMGADAPVVKVKKTRKAKAESTIAPLDSTDSTENEYVAAGALEFTSTTDMYAFVTRFAQRIMRDYGVSAEFKKSRRQVSFFQTIGKRTYLAFTPTSLGRDYKFGFSEYKTLEKYIYGLDNKGARGLILLVCHEVAHLVTFCRFGSNHHHDKVFASVYAEILKKYVRS